MNLFISKDYLNNPTPPDVFLCNTHKKKIGQLPAYSRSGNFKWNTYSDIQFEIDRTYVDIIDGETKVHPLYDKVEAPRNIYVRNIGYFALQDIDDTSSDKDSKSVTAFSLEYTTSNKYLTNFHINTGEVDSIEVLYNEQYNGIDYSSDQDSFYKISDGYDPYESYYKQTYTDNDSYIYEQVQIIDEADYNAQASKNNDISAQPHEKLYMKNFPNVQFYNPSRQGLSLLHLVFKHIPEWNIGNVDQVLWGKERKFSEARVSVYDFLNSNIAETFGCVLDWDTETGLVHFYEEAEDGITEDNAVQTRWATDVYISKDNLANEVKVSYSSDDIKTKLVVTGSDGLDIREVNLGRNEIMDLSFYHTEEWMEDGLFEAYDHYLELLQEAETGKDKDGFDSAIFPMAYSDAMQGWVAANNRYNDLMNEIPTEGNVVLVGDKFKKLYCIHTPVDNAYANITINSGTQYVDKLYEDPEFKIELAGLEDGETYVVQGYLLTYKLAQNRFSVSNEARENARIALIQMLNMYHVDEDINADQRDNILLKMKNVSSDTATVRIYDKRKVATEYNPNVKYYTWNTDTQKYNDVETVIKDATDFDAQRARLGDRLHTNDYYIQSIVVKAISGISEAPDEYSISRWINGELTAEAMDLEEYKITSIGTMGAYLVLAKDETIPENLQDFGIKLLQEKHKTYTTIFQTQTEAMFSQEKYQCIVQDKEPEGDYVGGTRWLDSNSVPTKLYKYVPASGTIPGHWEEFVGAENAVTIEDKKNYENYQRYIDNYDKLQAVQEVLTKKNREAEFCLNGYAVPDRSIDLSLYTMGADGNMRYNGELLEGDMHRAAEEYFGINYTIVRNDINQYLPLYTFTTSFDPIVYGKNTESFNKAQTYYVQIAENVYSPIEINAQEQFETYDNSTTEKTLYVVKSGHHFAVYLKGTTPYVAYANSQGVYQMIMEYIRDKTEMNTFFTTEQWLRLSPLIREDEFNDSNFLFTGYESEEERIRICKELMESASKELRTLCQPSLAFSMTMANILALPEFEPLFNQFQLGNFIRVKIRDGYIKRARLLEINLNFDDLSDFSCTFGNLKTTKSEIDKHADLLKTAVTAGKQVAKSSGAWQKSVDKTNKLEQEIANGLQDMALAIGGASGQAISWDSTGMHFRKYRDGSTTEFEPEEIAIINNALVATNDSWRTSKSAFGKYTVNGETRWGAIAEYVTSDIIEGKHISGGSLKIGGYDGSKGTFIVHEDGSVEILGPDAKTPVYATQDEVDLINQATQYRTSLEYTGTTIFTEPGQTCTITCRVFNWDDEITDKLPSGTVFKWVRSSNVSDTLWNNSHTYTDINTITITNEDIEKNAQFYCECTFDETKLL